MVEQVFLPMERFGQCIVQIHNARQRGEMRPKRNVLCLNFLVFHKRHILFHNSFLNLLFYYLLNVQVFQRWILGSHLFLNITLSLEDLNNHYDHY